MGAMCTHVQVQAGMSVCTESCVPVCASDCVWHCGRGHLCVCVPVTACTHAAVLAPPAGARDSHWAQVGPQQLQVTVGEGIELGARSQVSRQRHTREGFARMKAAGNSYSSKEKATRGACVGLSLRGRTWQACCKHRALGPEDHGCMTQSRPRVQTGVQGN